MISAMFGAKTTSIRAPAGMKIVGIQTDRQTDSFLVLNIYIYIFFFFVEDLIHKIFWTSFIIYTIA